MGKSQRWLTSSQASLLHSVCQVDKLLTAVNVTTVMINAICQHADRDTQTYAEVLTREFEGFTHAHASFVTHCYAFVRHAHASFVQLVIHGPAGILFAVPLPHVGVFLLPLQYFIFD